MVGHTDTFQKHLFLVGVEFNAPPDTI